MNNEVEMKIQRILELCEAGNDRHEVAKMLGYKDYKGLQKHTCKDTNTHGMKR